jgi:cytochrome c
MRLLYAGLLGLVLAGCGPDGGQQVAGDAAPAEPVDINALVASADPNRGQSLYLQCRACHSLEQGGVNKVGPNLHGMFGSKAGFAEGFVYSDAIKGADIVWTPETLNEWLERPSQFLPGNRMIFVGIRRPEDRAAIIAFLKRETSIQGP